LQVERQWPLFPLPLPDLERLPPLADLQHAPAVALFVARAEMNDPHFALTPDTARSVAKICHLVDGVPLAIELAAAHVTLLSPGELAARLDQRLPLLTGGRRDAPARQQTMRSTIAWSYDLLSSEAKRLFRRLSVFVGGWTMTAAASVANLDGTVDVLSDLRALVDASLVQGRDVAVGDRRFRMLETIREYAWEQLEAQGETRGLRDAQAAWCLALAEQARSAWFTPGQTAWADRFDLEQDNLNAALVWSADCGGTDIGIRLIGRLWPYWFIRGHITAGRTWSEAGLRWTAGHQTIERVRILTAASCFVRTQGDEPRATVLGEEARCLAETIGAGRGIDAVHALIGLALTAAIRQDTAQATMLNQTILELLRDLDETEPSASAIASIILVNWAELLRECGETEGARQLVEEALGQQRLLGFIWAEADSLMTLAMMAHARGEAGIAARYCRDSLVLGWTGRDPQQLLGALDMLGQLAYEAGHLQEAAYVLGIGDQIREQLGVPRDPSNDAEGVPIRDPVRGVHGDARYHDARTAGQEHPMEQAISKALALATKLAGHSGSPDYRTSMPD
jgi:predicted ATPase